MRTQRRKKRSAEKPSRVAGDAKPVTFRMSATARIAKSAVGEPPPAAEPSHPMSALVAGVEPLPGKERVAVGRSTGGRAARRPGGAAPRKAHAFVLSRDDHGVQGHRADLPPPRIAPGHARNWAPEVRADLHGVRARDLDARLAVVIGGCVTAARGRLLLIHGKGLHSESGKSILAEAVLDLLTGERHSRFVRAFSTAPERLGGKGALAVELDV